MTKIKIKAYAKINLMLDIVNRRTDGYHDLFMVMQSVGVYDDVTVEKTNDGLITLSCSDETIPTDERNIAHKAACAFFKMADVKNTGVSIHIEKRIPSAAGLAGGSADGAAVIVALNELFSTALSEKELCKIGVTVGADLPFCICGGTKLAQGIGDVLSNLKPLRQCFIVLAKPEYGVNTAKAYKAFDEHGKCREPDKLSMLKAMQNRNLDEICSLMSNSFEEFVEVPDRVRIRSLMYDHGAKGVCMSGSGPTTFGIFYDKESANKCAQALSEFIKDVVVCKPVSAGCKICK